MGYARIKGTLFSSFNIKCVGIYIYTYKNKIRSFLGGPVVKTLCFQHRALVWPLIRERSTTSQHLPHCSAVAKLGLTLCDPVNIRLPCPSLSPGVCSDSCPLSRWCHLPFITTRIDSHAVAAADLQHSGGRSPGWRAKVRHSLLGAVGEGTGRTGLQIAWYFQELILWARFLYLPISGKALKSFMVMTAPHA